MLEALLQDLGQRESHGVNSLNETRWIEPPYLQIVCARLWALNKDNAERVLKLSSYVQAGGAKGILKKFLVQALAKFSRAEKQIASQTFDYLAAQRGVKMAYPVEVLAKITGLKPARLAPVLDKLAGSEVRILRTQQRAEVTWYELYHDLFSESVNDWNYTYKKWRRRQYLCLESIKWLLVLAVVLLLLESFLWVKNNRVPLEYLLQKQKFYLMHWGVLAEPLPEMVEIPLPRGKVTIGEHTGENGQALSDWMRQNKLYNQKNFGYPTVKVKLTNAFFMSKYEITYEQYDYYVWQQHRAGVNPKELLYPKSRWKNERGLYNYELAVTQVSWGEAVAYTRWLSAKTGETYRLPTEVEWEYAARAGTQTAYWWGDNSLNGEKDTERKDRAHCGDCGSQWEYNSTPYIGRYPANPWGLHDTAGNVWEWTCSAWRVRLDAQASLCAAEDNQDGRVLRGGSWSSSTVWLRSAARFRNSVNDQRSDVGFRVVQLSNAP
ncbi:MAG: hypothetical protein E6Q84_05745 [Thiothrix sp.]|nr:MAG: hypothetical protein E6Q84_05745 [Thiothrix sp.]